MTSMGEHTPLRVSHYSIADASTDILSKDHFLDQIGEFLNRRQHRLSEEGTTERRARAFYIIGIGMYVVINWCLIFTVLVRDGTRDDWLKAVTLEMTGLFIFCCIKIPLYSGAVLFAFIWLNFDKNEDHPTVVELKGKYPKGLFGKALAIWVLPALTYAIAEAALKQQH